VGSRFGNGSRNILNTDYNAFAQSSFQSPSQYKKTRGFIEFDLQLFRPDPQKTNCHEKRLEPYNYFPTNLSDNKPIRKIDFNLVKARDNLCYRGVHTSDSLYDHKKHLNLFHQKEVGILHFAKIGEKRGDAERRLNKLKEFSDPKDHESYMLSNP
jgi:hypothetical protein